MAIDTDLEYLRSIAESGRQAPLLGGRFFVWWGMLTAITLLIHWAVITGALPLPGSMIGAVWLAFAVVGITGTAVLARSMRGKPGTGATGNRAERAVWSAMTAAIFAYAIGVAIAAGLGRASAILFDTIPLVAFCGYGISFAVTAAMGGPGWMKPLAWFSWLMAAAGLSFTGTPELYLYASGVVLVLTLVPGFIILRQEPKGGSAIDE